MYAVSCIKIFAQHFFYFIDDYNWLIVFTNFATKLQFIQILEAVILKYKGETL